MGNSGTGGSFNPPVSPGVALHPDACHEASNVDAGTAGGGAAAVPTQSSDAVQDAVAELGDTGVPATSGTYSAGVARAATGSMHAQFPTPFSHMLPISLPPGPRHDCVLIDSPLLASLNTPKSSCTVLVWPALGDASIVTGV